MGNVEKVKQIYEAFGRGDIPAILYYLEDAVEWEYGVNSTKVPWLQPLNGRDEVPKFFEALDREIEFQKFEQKTILESGNVVVVLFDLEATVKSTGKRILEEDEVHIWHFNEKGKVNRFRHRADTFQQALAITS
jgi:ketosteroid isomerase-like protein